ncbi:MAG: sulfatase-like hydrolase/transferase [Caldilineaceae bacterium]
MPKSLLRRYPDQIFGACFLLLNCLLFLPAYLLNLDDTTLLPVAEWLGRDIGLDWQRLLIWRTNLDPWRWNIELILLVALWVNVAYVRRRWLRNLLAAIYLFTVAYYSYEALMVAIYQNEPNFYSHYYLALDGLHFLLEHLQLSLLIYLVGALGIVTVFVVLYGLARLLYHIPLAAALSPWTRRGVGVLAVAALVAIVTLQQTLALPSMVASSLVYKVKANLQRSFQLYAEVTRFDDTQLQQVYNYGDQGLRHKPNLYLIFVESYGSVLYKRPDYRSYYGAILRQLQDRLDGAGWQAVSALSESPTWGGGSWLAYTSALFGLHIDNHPEYLTLFNKYQHATYPHLGNFLKTQGYRDYFLSSISNELSDSDWLNYQRFYNADRWIRYQDLNYQGQLYGWGPSPADQYVLNYARELIHQETAEPFMLFFITQNSHYPFAPIPTFVDDWRTINQSDPAAPSAPTFDAEQISHNLRRQNYANAIHYELDTLIDFVLRAGDEDAIFVFIGDHQPPRVSRRADDLSTPIHIVSRDPQLLAALQQYGFEPGLQVTNLEPALKHEGLYSLLAQTLTTVYGSGQHAHAPVYLPDGFVVEHQAMTQ